MMLRDTTALSPVSQCWVIIDNQTIANYIDGDKETYKLVSDKWFLVATTTESTPAPGTLQCYSQEQINAIPSHYDFITPIYHTVAIASAIFIFWVAYRLMLYPFFRGKV